MAVPTVNDYSLSEYLYLAASTYQSNTIHDTLTDETVQKVSIAFFAACAVILAIALPELALLAPMLIPGGYFLVYDVCMLALPILQGIGWYAPCDPFGWQVEYDAFDHIFGNSSRAGTTERPHSQVCAWYEHLGLTYLITPGAMSVLDISPNYHPPLELPSTHSRGICFGLTMALIAQNAQIPTPNTLINRAMELQTAYSHDHTEHGNEDLRAEAAIAHTLGLRCLMRSPNFSPKECYSSNHIKLHLEHLLQNCQPTGIKLNLVGPNGNHTIYINPHTFTFVDLNLTTEEGQLAAPTFNSLEELSAALFWALKSSYANHNQANFSAYAPLN
ncbi:MAG: hypothetical protein SP1CHLAM54_12900 [Chlamydiia bacterium]|nr:hypothetical protein [Chlamydiia bacterium]MCH9616186.1 hypothetical protein [Chlamydiia bacterium]MCH9629828.1 hypothetical protein [Chlamydiia bacterium]